jgi:hypothetical protein
LGKIAGRDAHCNPGIMFFLGMGDPEKGTDAQHHSPDFKTNDTSFRGVEIPGKTVDTFFKPVSWNNCLNTVESNNGRVHAVILVKG